MVTWAAVALLVGGGPLLPDHLKGRDCTLDPPDQPRPCWAVRGKATLGHSVEDASQHGSGLAGVNVVGHDQTVSHGQ